MLLHKVVYNINQWNIFLTLLHYLIHVWIKIDNTETSHISISICKASSNSTTITNNTVFFLKPCCKFIPCDTIIFFLPKVTKEWPKVNLWPHCAHGCRNRYKRKVFKREEGF